MRRSSSTETVATTYATHSTLTVWVRGIGAYEEGGCTEEAFNYDPEAVYDDGSCEW